jgi:hypothetical protein
VRKVCFVDSDASGLRELDSDASPECEADAQRVIDKVAAALFEKEGLREVLREMDGETVRVKGAVVGIGDRESVRQKLVVESEDGEPEADEERDRVAVALGDFETSELPETEADIRALLEPDADEKEDALAGGV